MLAGLDRPNSQRRRQERDMREMQHEQEMRDIRERGRQFDSFYRAPWDR